MSTLSTKRCLVSIHASITRRVRKESLSNVHWISSNTLWHSLSFASRTAIQFVKFLDLAWCVDIQHSANALLNGRYELNV